MAFAMDLNRETTERDTREFASVLHDASFAVTCGAGHFRGRALPDNANQLLCEALPAGTKPSSSAEAAPTA